MLVVRACLAVGCAIVMSHGVLGEEVDFARTIRPLLSDRCFRCHGPDEANRQAELHLDDSQSALGELASGAGHAFVPGKPAESIAYQRITAEDEKQRMPPADSGLTLHAAERELIRTWIAEGAGYRRHWAYIPLPATLAVPQIQIQIQIQNQTNHRPQGEV